MTIELLYTSAAQGLKQGSRGFCTVLCTAGLPINLAQRLEALSGYRHLYQPGDTRADENPVSHSHIRLVVGGKTLSIVSRVAAFGVDYSQRTNKIAHHVVFDGPVPSCGPAAVLSQTTIMRANWDGECKTLANGPVIPPLNVQPEPCQHWQSMTGDAGWAGVVANAWLQPTGKPVWIIFNESQSKSLLMMMEEATALLPESRRWQATFSTYCTNLPPDVECRVRCVVAGSDEARMSIARGVVLDLTKPLGVAPNSEAAEAARNGYTIGAKTNSIPSMASAPENDQDPENEFESAFANRKDKDDYGLQPQLPNVAPVLLKSPKSRGTLKEKRVVGDPLYGAFSNRAVLLAAIGFAIVLSLLGGFTIWFASGNKISGIIDSEPAPKEKSPELPSQPEDLKKDEKETGLENATAEDGSHSPPTSPPPHTIVIPKFSISQSIKEIDENMDINPASEIASITIENPDAMDFNISMDSKHFRYQDGKVYFLAPPVRYDFETQSELIGAIRLIAKDAKVLDEKTFAVKVKDLIENKLEFTVSNENGQKQPKFVFAGSKLIATINQGSIDMNEKEPFNRNFVWKGRNGTNAWTEVSNSSGLVADTRFSEVYCELQYSHKSQSPNTLTKVRSEPIKINALGKAEIDFSSIFDGNDLKMNISVPFPDFAIEDGASYRFRWAQNDNYLKGNRLNMGVTLESYGAGIDDNKPFTKIMKSVPQDQIRTATKWLQQAVYQSGQVKEKLTNWKLAVNAVKLSPDPPILIKAFRLFVGQIKAEPNEEFFSSIEQFDKWVGTCVTFRKLVAEIEDAENKEKNQVKNEADIQKLVQKKKEVLEELADKYIAAFKVPKKNLLPSDQVERAIIEFASAWENDINEANAISANRRATGRLVPASKGLADLIDSIQTLRRTIDSSSEFEITLESVDAIKIFKVQTDKTSSGTLESRKQQNESLLVDRVFRVRTSILFDGIKPPTVDLVGKVEMTNSQSTPQNASSSPRNAQVTNVFEEN